MANRRILKKHRDRPNQAPPRIRKILETEKARIEAKSRKSKPTPSYLGPMTVRRTEQCPAEANKRITLGALAEIALFLEVPKKLNMEPPLTLDSDRPLRYPHAGRVSSALFNAIHQTTTLSGQMPNMEEEEMPKPPQVGWKETAIILGAMAGFGATMIFWDQIKNFFMDGSLGGIVMIGVAAATVGAFAKKMISAPKNSPDEEQ